MTSHFKASAFLRWLCPLLVVVVILAMSPGAVLAAAKPGAPTGLTATAGNGQVSLAWTAPASDGGDPITDYRVQYRKAGSLTWVTFPDGGGNATTATVKLLTNGTSYEFRVKAKNAVGLGAPSNVASATPGATGPGKPGAPTGLTATAGDKKVTLSWTAPADNGGSAITDYRVQYRKAGALTWVTFPDGGGTATTAIVKPLANGTAYEFRVKAKNAVGLGAPSNVASATPGSTGPTVPDAPTDLTATAGDEQVALDWDAPYNGGSPITDYRVQYREPGALTWRTYPDGTSTATAATVKLLPNGIAFEFQVRALNAIGWGPPSNIASATPNEATPPGAPLNLTATPGNQQVTLDLGCPLRRRVADHRLRGAVLPRRRVQQLDDLPRRGRDRHGSHGDRPDQRTPCTSSGSRHVNGDRMAARGRPPPPPPTNPAAPCRESRANLHVHSTRHSSTQRGPWTGMPLSDGGSPITDYEVQYQRCTGWIRGLRPDTVTAGAAGRSSTVGPRPTPT